MNNKKIKKMSVDLLHQNQLLADNMNRIVNSFAQHVKNLHDTQHQILLNVDAINNILNSKSIITTEELKVELDKISNELRVKSEELQNELQKNRVE